MGYTIELTRGKVAFVDDADADLAELQWYFRPGGRRDHGYAMRRDGKRYVRMHRVILERMLVRALRPGEMCDHIDGNELNNRRSNLRVVTRSQNGINRRGKGHGRAGRIGVRIRANGRYQATIRLAGKLKSLGTFDTMEEAVAARETAEREAGV